MFSAMSSPSGSAASGSRPAQFRQPGRKKAVEAYALIGLLRSERMIRHGIHLVTYRDPMLNDAETPEPGQTFTPKQIRILKISVVIMSALLVVGFGLLLVGIYLQASKIGQTPNAARPPVVAAPAAGAPSALPVTVAPGTELHEALADQGRLILHLKRGGESEFAVIDLATGREVQRIRLEPRP
jgi:hypothetical protein